MSLPDLTPRDWWVGLGVGELAEVAEQWAEEAERLRLALGGRPVPEPSAPVAQGDAVTLRAIAAVLDVLDEHDRGGLDIVARVALLVGEVRTLRAALERWV